MKSNYVSNLKILFFVLLVVARSLFGQECNSNGISCISCNSYQKCDAGSPVGPVISCKNGDACDQAELDQCQMKYNCYDLNECIQAGVFPNAQDESNYYVCLNDPTAFVKYEFTCVDGEFFDKTTSMCIPKAATLSDSTSSTETSSESSTSSTESSSESSSTTSTESSSESSPSTSSTQSSSESSSSTSTESSSESSSTTSTESSSESSPTTSTETSSESSTTSSTEITTPTSPGTTISTTASPFACVAAGIFPSPSNCKMYHRCSTSLKLFNYVCPGTSYFNENILKCSMTITPACQAQILKNTSSTVTTPPTTSPTTKATTSTTISTPPTTTSTTTTSTTITTPPTTTISSPTTPKLFSCPSSGTFSNPNSCKTYYRCSTSGKIFTYTCPGSTYFNEFTKRCGLEITPTCQRLLQG